MVQITEDKLIFEKNEELHYIECSCLHTDSKPTDGIATGSLCIEVDTGKVYLYNSDGETWVEQFSLQS